MRNDGIKFDVHFKNYILPNIVIFDLKKVSSDKAVADIFRVFLQTSSALKDSKFDKIILSFQGKDKFYLKGDYFKQLGKTYEIQNPIYTMRTFPEHVFNLKGVNAYGVWSGGLLGVLSKQMKDFNNKWYLNDINNQFYK